MRACPRPLLHKFSRGLAELYEAGRRRPPLAALAEFFGGLLASELTVVGHRKPDQTHAIQSWPKTLDVARHNAAYEHHVAAHPVRNRFQATRDPGPHLLSDSVTLSAFKQTGLYCDYFRHFGITRLMAIYAPLDDGAHFSIGVSRNGRDFSDEERLLLALGQPHLIAAGHLELERERAAAGGTPAGESDGLRIPKGVALTAREGEVLQWIVAGKTNPEIALILGISRWTVKTHVERILGKLGVENRTSAISLIRSHG